MMDTSTETVERLANAVLYDMQRMTPGAHQGAVAATLRALAAERDALRERQKQDADTFYRAMIAAITDRDAARVEVERLREALSDVANALKPHVQTNEKVRQPYDHPLSAYDRAVALLEQKDTPHE